MSHTIKKIRLIIYALELFRYNSFYSQRCQLSNYSIKRKYNPLDYIVIMECCSFLTDNSNCKLSLSAMAIKIMAEYIRMDRRCKDGWIEDISILIGMWYNRNTIQMQESLEQIQMLTASAHFGCYHWSLFWLICFCRKVDVTKQLIFCQQFTFLVLWWLNQVSFICKSQIQQPGPGVHSTYMMCSRWCFFSYSDKTLGQFSCWWDKHYQTGKS